MPLVRVNRLPAHVAIIMDGNGRWAQQLGRPRPEGHRRGSDAVRRTVRLCRRLGIGALTLYAFSEQNWERPQEEVDALMGLLREFLESERDEILDNRIRLRAIGRIDRLPPHVREVLDPLVADSRDNDGMVLTLALSYGGREEITDAVREIARGVEAGEMSVDGIDEEAVNARMPSVEPGQVDLLVRTGGEQRISNFLLWGAAYAELFFSPALWPDYSPADLFDALSAYESRDRRFGRVSSADATSDPEQGSARAHV